MWKRRVVFLLTILFSVNSYAQKKKKDEYLKNLVKKIQFEYKELYFKEGSLDVLKDVVDYINTNKGYYLITSSTTRNGNTNSNQKLTSSRALM